MDPEDLEPRKQTPEKKNFDPMSVEELRRYIADLECEIARAHEAIVVKEKVRAGAEAFFKR